MAQSKLTVVEKIKILNNMNVIRLKSIQKDEKGYCITASMTSDCSRLRFSTEVKEYERVYSIKEIIDSIKKEYYISNLSLMNRIYDKNGVVHLTPDEYTHGNSCEYRYNYNTSDTLLNTTITIKKEDVERNNNLHKCKIVNVNKEKAEITLQGANGKTKEISIYELFNSEGTHRPTFYTYISNISELDVFSSMEYLVIDNSEEGISALKQFISGIRWIIRCYTGGSLVPLNKRELDYRRTELHLNTSYNSYHNFGDLYISFTKQGMVLMRKSLIKDVPSLMNYIVNECKLHINNMWGYDIQKRNIPQADEEYKKNYNKLVEGMQEAYNTIKSRLKEEKM